MQEESLSVIQFNKMIRSQLEVLGPVIVTGEIVQLNITQRGGVNIDLKDEKGSALVRVSGYAPQVQGISNIKEGDSVSVWGTPTVWEEKGLFSLKAFKILATGEGALREAYEKLLQKLTQEGLFDDSRKRALPEFILKIALVTAKGSAAESDFLKILKENNAAIEVDFYPVHVQGRYAEIEIINALKYADQKDYDCIVLTRGGGSLEDLIAFNDEQLARTIFSMSKPVIVGVGHERDESVSDFVSDMRASTPSQAAYYLASHNETFLRKLDLQTIAIKDSLEKQIFNQKSLLEMEILDIKRHLDIYLKEYTEHLHKSEINIQKISTRLSSKINQKLWSIIRAIESKLSEHILFAQGSIRHSQKVLDIFPNLINKHLTDLELAKTNIERFPKQINDFNAVLSSYDRLLLSYNPKAVLERGYAIIKAGETYVSSIKSLQTGQNISISLKDGEIESKIISKHQKQ